MALEQETVIGASSMALKNRSIHFIRKPCPLKPSAMIDHGKVSQVRINKRQPLINIADLALMLEIDLLMGNRADFIKRLQKALDSAASISPSKY